VAAYSAQAQSSVTLAWNPITDGNVAGYNVYYGTASQVYTMKIPAGNSTSVIVPGLTGGKRYYFAVTAYDTSDLESDYSSEISYTVPAGLPTVTLTAPGNGAIYLAPASVNLAASVAANGHSISKVQFYNGGTLLGQDTSSPYTFTWNNVAAGSYTLTARVTYDSGATANSSPAVVSVSGASPKSVINLAATAGAITAPMVSAGGAIRQNASTTLLNSGSAVYNFTVSKAGNYCVSALVNAPNSGENAFYVNIDTQPTAPLMIWDIPKTSGFANRVVSWRGNGNGNPANDQYPRKTFSLAAGFHQLIIRGKNANTALQSISIYAAPPALIPARDANGQLTLTATGQPGQTYDVMASQNFSTWTVIGTVTLNSGGSVQFSDPANGSAGNRSYRLRQH
jgi:hypothetical protein